MNLYFRCYLVLRLFFADRVLLTGPKGNQFNWASFTASSWEISRELPKLNSIVRIAGNQPVVGCAFRLSVPYLPAFLSPYASAPQPAAATTHCLLDATSLLTVGGWTAGWFSCGTGPGSWTGDRQPQTYLIVTCDSLAFSFYIHSVWVHYDLQSLKCVIFLTEICASFNVVLVFWMVLTVSTLAQ